MADVGTGINCGPAFAGVIGSKCPRYCFLGTLDIFPACTYMRLVCQAASKHMSTADRMPYMNSLKPIQIYDEKLESICMVRMHGLMHI